MRYLHLLFLCGIFLVGATACGAPAVAPPPVAAPLTADAVLYYDNAGGIRDSIRTVIRDEAALRMVWEQATAVQESPPPLPGVDFSREMLLVVAAGQMTPEDEIHVDSVTIHRDRMVALVRTAEGCGRIDADAYPVEIVRVPRFTGTVEFVERRERAPDCG